MLVEYVEKKEEKTEKAYIIVVMLLVPQTIMYSTVHYMLC